MSLAFSVIVTSYNFSEFVCEALDSALAQVPAVREVVVVDDGSTDGSPELLRSRYGADPRVRLIVTENGGQLAAFVRGFAATSGDVVCFLDADDVWRPGYVARLDELYRHRPDVDFVYGNMCHVGAREGFQFEEAVDRDVGPGVLLASFRMKWIGSPTSALSLRRTLARRVLDVSERYWTDFRTRADDALVYGGSILGGRKHFLAEALVDYRFHGRNNFQTRKRTRESRHAHRDRVRRLLDYYMTVAGITPESLVGARAEFLAKPSASASEVRNYLHMVRKSPQPLSRRIADVFAILRHYRKLPAA